MSGVEATELYALKWSNHNNFLTQRLYEQCRIRSNTDVTIAVEGENEFPAHKLVLSSCSEFFREHFEKSPCANPRVVIPGVSPELFSLILRYMYLGEINCPKTHLQELILVSRHLKIKGLQEDDPIQSDTSDFVVRPINPVKSNGAFSQHRCDDDDMEGRFKKIVVSPFAETPEQRLPQPLQLHQALERRPAPPQAPPHVAHNNNTNSGSGKWEGKQSGRRKGLPKKLGAPRTPINDIAEELRQRSLSVSPRPLIIADPACATVPANGSHHSGEHSPPQNSLSSGGTAESSYSAAESAAAVAAASASAVASMSTSLPVDLSSPQRTSSSSDAAAAIAAAKASGNSTSPLAMDAIQNYFKMTGMKSGGSGLFENLANKTLEQYLANNIHNGSPSMLSLSDTLGMDPNSLPEHLRKYFNAAAASSSLAASFAALNQTPGAATSEAAGSPTGAEGLLLAAAHLGPLGTDSPLGEADGGGGAPASQLKKGGKKPRRSAVNIVYGADGQPQIGPTGKPMVRCEICGKELADPSSLYRHRKIHNGEKPHQCHYCERKFIQRYNMVQHMKVHEKKMRRQEQMELQAKQAELQSELLQMHAEQPAYSS